VRAVAEVASAASSAMPTANTLTPTCLPCRHGHGSARGLAAGLAAAGPNPETKSNTMNQDYPESPPRRGSTTQQPASGYPRRGQPSERPDVDDDLPRRDKPAREPVTPPRQPSADRNDLPPRRPGSAVARSVPSPADEADLPPPRRPDAPPSRPAAQGTEDYIEPDPKPKARWDFEQNKQRLTALLTAEWAYWGPEHRPEFEDAIVEAVAPLFSGKMTAAAEAVVRAPVGNPPPPAAPAPAVEDEPEPED
jgi:hypothetical protein